MLSRVARAVWARAFSTTSSGWFCCSLEDVDSAKRYPARDAEVEMRFWVNDKDQLIEWIRRHHEQFPWIYLTEEVECAVRERHVFVGFLHATDIIGFIKVGVADTYIGDFRQVIHLPPHDALIYDTFVLPEYRGRGVAHAGIMATMQYLKAHGFDRVWCHIEAWNHPSLRVFGRAGFERVGEIRFLRVCGFPFFVRDGRVPFLNLQRFVDQRAKRSAT